MSDRFAVVEARPEHGDALRQLFAATGYGCYCRFWHFEGNAREWLMRCANSPDQNRSELEAALGRGSDEARGLVALSEAGEAIGWLKLTPAEAVRKIYEQRLYKGLPCFSGDRRGVFTLGCVLVREDRRHQGVARALIERAVELAPGWGARSIEAFPRRDTEVADAALMMGPLSVLERLGFSVVHESTPYPVLRKVFTEPA